MEFSFLECLFAGINLVLFAAIGVILIGGAALIIRNLAK